MDKKEIQRAKAVLCMEYLARQINDEDILEGWLINGVADGDIPYGSINIEDVDEYYIDPDNFKRIALCFMRRMRYAYEDGGLWCGDVLCDKNNNERYVVYKAKQEIAKAGVISSMCKTEEIKEVIRYIYKNREMTEEEVQKLLEWAGADEYVTVKDIVE